VRSRAQNPQDAVQHFAVVAPRTPASIGANPRLRNQRRDNRPLFIGEVHAFLLGAFRDAVEKQLTSLRPFVRPLLVTFLQQIGAMPATAARV